MRKLRTVERIAPIGRSRGGRQAGGRAAQHPGEVSKLVLLVPGYDRTAQIEAPSLSGAAPAFNTQNRTEFLAFWDEKKASPDHFDPLAMHSVWGEMLASDPVGAMWGPGVRLAPEMAQGAAVGLRGEVSGGAEDAKHVGGLRAWPQTGGASRDAQRIEPRAAIHPISDARHSVPDRRIWPSHGSVRAVRCHRPGNSFGKRARFAV